MVAHRLDRLPLSLSAMQMFEAYLCQRLEYCIRTSFILTLTRQNP